MTSQKAQIQALLNGIDEVLSKTSPRLPWVMSNDAAQQRQMLEQTRQYLLSLQQQLETDRALPPDSAAFASPGAPSSESAQQVLQAVLQEMNYWRVNMLQPLRTEVDALQRQREMITQDLRRLESQRQQYALPAQNQQMLMEFLQAAMAQMQSNLQANLSAQMTQMIAAQTTQALPADRSDSQGLMALSPAERLVQLQKMQSQSDQLMLKLDSTLQMIFESLSRNVQSYQDSLEQGLDRMHSLGQQGEAVFAYLVNRFAQQVGREASSILQQSSNWTPDANTLSDVANPEPSNPTQSGKSQGASQAASQAASQDIPDQPGRQPSEFTVADFLNQPPDRTNPSANFAPAVPFDLSEEVLDIADLADSLGSAGTPDRSESPDAQSAATQPAAAGADTLDNLSRELSHLDLTGESGSSALFSGDLFPDASNLLAANGSDSPASPSTTGRTIQVELPTDSSANYASTTDLDSALDLLNQLSAEMQNDPLALEASIGAASQPPAGNTAREPELIASPDALYQDAFYQGSAASELDRPSRTESNRENLQLDGMTLEQAWFDGLGDPAAQAPTPEVPDLKESVGRSLETLGGSATASQEDDSEALFTEFVLPEVESASVGNVSSAQPLTAAEPPDMAPDITQSLTELLPPDWTDRQTDQTLPVAEAVGEALDLGLTTPLESGTAPATGSLDQFTADFASESPSADNATPAASIDRNVGTNEVTNEVTIEGLENLFADLPAAETRNPSPATPVLPTVDTRLEDLFTRQPGISSVDGTAKLADWSQLFEVDEPDSEKKN